MWDAFTGLCETGTGDILNCEPNANDDKGAAIRVQNIFKTNPEMLAMLSSVDSNANSMTILEEPATISLPLQSTRSASNPFGATDPFASQPVKGHSESGSSIGNAGLFRKLNESTMSGLQVFTSSGNLRPRTEGLETPPGATREAEILHTRDPIAPGLPEPPQAPVRRARTAQGTHSEAVAEAPPRMRGAYARPRSRLKSDDQESSDNGHNGVHGERKRTISGQVAQPHLTRSNDLNNAPQRRSDRLLNQIRPISSKFSSAAGGISSREGRELKKAKATGTKGRVGTATSTVGRAISGNRKLPSDSMDLDAKETHSRPPLPTSHSAPVEPIRSRSSDSSKKEEALQWILSLFATLGHGLFCLTHFCSDKAMETFAALPTPQRETPWVLAQMGRAHYEQANYTEAEEYFAKIRSVAPARMEDMEIYSTVLWHLKNDVELAYLAHELIEVDRLSPQAWCCVGNSFSLQRDHDQALKCFKRATQLDPKFAYAFTLQGHEHIANEEHDKAQAAYRSAISVDNRHYNAWYGLGKVYEKMGKYETAEKHYRTAAQINTTNAVLICCIGVVLEKLRVPSDALRHYTRACELAPRSALARFKKARVLMTMQEPHKALAELMILKDIAPDEANVHYLLGRLYKMLRQKANAIKHFTISLNLDPKVCSFFSVFLPTSTSILQITDHSI